jgi:ABC-2 type transport system permease protein
MKFNINRILAIIKKEFSQIKRDKRTIAIIIMMPIMELLLFGYAASTSVDHIPTAILNNDIGAESRELLDSLVNSQYFDLDYYGESMDDIETYIDKGYAKAGVIIPSDFSSDIKSGKTAQIQLIIDGTDPTTAQTILSSAGGVVQSMSVEIMEDIKGMDVEQPLDLRSRVWYNPDMSSIYFNIPGLIGVILQTVTLMLTSFSIVRERERGTMEQLIVTPITKMELMVGKIIPYVIIGFVDIVLALAISVFWFRVPISGSISLLLLFSIIFLFGALGCRTSYFYSIQKSASGNAVINVYDNAKHTALRIYVSKRSYAKSNIWTKHSSSSNLFHKSATWHNIKRKWYSTTV